MTHITEQAVRRVLREASNSEHFFDLSDGERLLRMIAMGFELGRKSARKERRHGADSVDRTRRVGVRKNAKRR